MYLGSAWYPEHWGEDRWPEDCRLMREVGFSVVRLGEFAWSRLEPEEGRFDIGWLERAIAVAAEYGQASVVGTPSAAPPAWLTQRYPEVLAVRVDGRREEHGARCHYSPTSPVYRQFARRVAEETAKMLGDNPHVIGWQIDNEYNSASYDDETKRQFQQWLAERYGTLDELNRRYTAAFWSQEYTDWSQISLPKGQPILPQGSNHGLILDFRRFITHTYRTFQKEQIDVIRPHIDPRQWITHNFMGFYDLFDHYELCADLDMASWDSYIGSGYLNWHWNGAAHDLTRGFKRRNFWVMETQCGWICGSPGMSQCVLDRGEVRTLTWHHIGHGADGVLYWEWRAALNGQEQYAGTIVGSDGKLRRQHVEYAQLGAEFAKAADALDGTTPVSEVAILHSYEDRWTINNFRQNLNFCPLTHMMKYYAPLRDITHEMDVVHPLAPLEGYKLVVAPSLHLMDDERARHLRGYVMAGGHLVLGARSGAKDDCDAFLPSRQPGALADLLGAHVDEFYSIGEDVPISGEWGAGSASHWAELMQPDSPDVEVLARYGVCNGWLDGEPTAVTRRVGNGRITYIGAWLDDSMMRAAAEWMLGVSGVKPRFGPVPDGVEVCRRRGNNREVFVVINHAKAANLVGLPRPMTDVLTNEAHDASVEMPPYGVVVLV